MERKGEKCYKINGKQGRDEDDNIKKLFPNFLQIISSPVAYKYKRI